MAKSKRKGGCGNKVAKVMDEWKHHKLHSGSKQGPTVVKYRQAVAIALSEQRRCQGGKKRGVSKKKRTTRGTRKSKKCKTCGK
jgi:hypothetical protein